MDDNIWEYPFGDLEDDDDMFYRPPDRDGSRIFDSTNRDKGLLRKACWL
jgi:hypothetical protein